MPRCGRDGWLPMSAAIDWDAQPLGQAYDRVIAQLLGVSRVQVMRERARRGIAPHGRRVRVRSAKRDGRGEPVLCDRKALAARYLWHTGPISASAIARHLGCCRTVIQRLVNGETYQHLPTRRDAVVAAWEALIREGKTT